MLSTSFKNKKGTSTFIEHFIAKNDFVKHFFFLKKKPIDLTLPTLHVVLYLTLNLKNQSYFFQFLELDHFLRIFSHKRRFNR